MKRKMKYGDEGEDCKTTVATIDDEIMQTKTIHGERNKTRIILSRKEQYSHSGSAKNTVSIFK